MLSELEHAFRTLVDFPRSAARGRHGAAAASSSSDDRPIGYEELLRHWDSRLQGVQVTERTNERRIPSYIELPRAIFGIVIISIRNRVRRAIMQIKFF